MLQPHTEQQWTNSFRAFVRHDSGNPRAQVNSQKYRWPKLIEVIEADPPDTPSPIGFTPAQVLNSAVVQKHTLRDVLGGFASKPPKQGAGYPQGWFTQCSSSKSSAAPAVCPPTPTATFAAACLWQAVARHLLNEPENSHIFSFFVDSDGNVQDQAVAVDFAAGKFKDGLPYLLEHLEHAERVHTAGELL